MNLLSALLWKPEVEQKQTISTGLTLLNLTLTGKTDEGIQAGSVVWANGPSGSGRTTVGLTLMAELAANTNFDDYGMYYCNTEGDKFSSSLERYIGSKAYNRTQPIDLMYVEDFWDTLERLDHPYIFFLDSLDGLCPKVKGKRQCETNNERAKYTFDLVRDKNSILIITAQEKKADQKKVACGGFSVPFYSDYILRTVNNGNITRRINNRKRIVGTDTSIKVIKCVNPIMGLNEVPAPVFMDYGYDNVESIVTFLVKMGYITPKQEDNGDYNYLFTPFCWNCTYSDIIERIRQNETDIINWLKEKWGDNGMGGTF